MKVILVTGASRGLGKEIAIAFGALKNYVVVNFKKSKQEAFYVTEEIIKAGGQSFAYQADVSKLSDVYKMVEQVIKKWKRIDVLINNAGIANDSLLIKMKQDSWNEVIATNLTGIFNCAKVVSRIMIKQKQGQIINISSLSGIKGRIGQSNYSASKSAVIGFTKSIAKELGQYNISVTAVLPGYMLTDMGMSAPQKVIDETIAENVLERLSQPKEIASFVVSLAGMKNISGQVFNLDSRIY